MKNPFTDIRTIIIAVLIIVVLLLRWCNPKTQPEPIVITKTEVKWDTITKVINNYVPKWKDRITIHTDTVWRENNQNIDTAEILKDYFASYYYSDVISNDSVTITINDTITENKIKVRNIKYDILYPTITITNETVINVREFYAGIGVGGTTTNFTYIGAEGLFKSKKRTAIGLGVGINRNFNLALMGKFYWKLGK